VLTWHAEHHASRRHAVVLGERDDIEDLNYADLYQGARRVAELAAERRELSERCARAEAAARAARDSCERLAMKLASALGPADGPLSRHAHATSLSTPASQHRARHGDAAREALLTLGRKTFEQRAAARKRSEPRRAASA
jgi:hypothetical protein